MPENQSNPFEPPLPQIAKIDDTQKHPHTLNGRILVVCFVISWILMGVIAALMPMLRM